ncbi:MAG: DUF3999 family protein, partial [Nevskiales bacterium]
MKRLAPIFSLLVALSVQAAEAPTLRDFAWRQEIQIEAGRPIQELALPDTVYSNILNADLSDLRVFSAEGGVVPHAFCAAPVTTPVEPVLETLAPFALQPGATPVTGEGGRIEIRTADGANVLITGPDGSAVPAPGGPSAYILDLRALRQPVHAIRLDWQSRDQASEATISLKSSEDLAQWMTLMPSATLLKAQSGEQSLQRARIPLPEREYRYLRIEAGASGPLPQIDSVVVERVTAPDPVPATWVEVYALPPDKQETATAFWFNAARRAPVHSAELRLPAANMALGVVLQSRDDPQHAWRTRWSGEIFAISSDSAQRGQTVVQFEPTSDRYWRLEVQRGAETLRGMSPSLLLGYRPARLRFLAQGAGPYQLAYASARVERRATPGCDSLLASLPADERVTMTGQAQASAMPLRGNLDVLKP